MHTQKPDLNAQTEWETLVIENKSLHKIQAAISALLRSNNPFRLNYYCEFQQFGKI